MDPLKATPQQETKLHFLDYWRIIRIRKTIILAVFLLVVITATLVTFILPESYASSARIKIERDQSDISGMYERGGNMPVPYDPYFIQTEFELIQSEVILGKVITELDLNKEWGRKYGGGDPLKSALASTLAYLNLFFTSPHEVLSVSVVPVPDRTARTQAVADFGFGRTVPSTNETK